MTELVAVRRDVVWPGVPLGVGGSTGVSDNVMQHVLEVLNELKAGQIRLEAGQAKLEAGLTSVEAGQGELGEGVNSLKKNPKSLRVELLARSGRRGKNKNP